jgi:hypothetical protein
MLLSSTLPELASSIGAFIIPVGESVNFFFQPKEGPIVTPPFVTFHASVSVPYGPAVEADRVHRNMATRAWQQSPMGHASSSMILTKRPRKSGQQH